MKAKNTFTKINAFITKHKYISCAAAGALYSLAFFCGYLFVFAFLGLFVYFLIAFEKGEDGFVPKKIWRKTFCFSLGFYIPLYSWFFALYPFEAFDFTLSEGIVIVIAADIGLGLFHSLINSSAFCLLYLFPKKTALLPLGAGVCMTVSEFVISNIGFLSFPWGIAAVGQYRFLPLIQTVSVLGPYVIALITGAFCASLAAACREPVKTNVRRAVLYIVCPLLLGTLLLVLPVSGYDVRNLTVSCVQGNIASMEKWDRAKLNENIESYRALAEEAASSGADLVVLPESAIPTAMTSKIVKGFSDVAEKYNTTLIISGIVYEKDKKYNSLLLIGPDGKISDERYDKRHLVPFGEYLPLESFLTKLLPSLKNINLSSSPFSAGDENNVLHMNDGNIRIGSLICFDSIFPSLARSDSDLLVVATNDSWYEDSPGVYQHEAQSALRAVENGKWVVRCANTGISCFISPKGVISGELAPLTEGITTKTINVALGHDTLYGSIGDVILVFPLCFIIYSLAFAIYKSVLNAKRKDKDNGNHQTL